MAFDESRSATLKGLFYFTFKTEAEQWEQKEYLENHSPISEPQTNITYFFPVRLS